MSMQETTGESTAEVDYLKQFKYYFLMHSNVISWCYSIVKINFAADA